MYISEPLVACIDPLVFRSGHILTREDPVSVVAFKKILHCTILTTMDAVRVMTNLQDPVNLPLARVLGKKRR